MWLDFIIFWYFKSAYEYEYYAPNLADECLDTASLDSRRYQETQRHPKVVGKEE